jgi:hypothetical protein
MTNPANVVKIFADRASNLLSIVSNNATSTTVTNRECEVADLLCDVLESITSSHSHTFEVETTLDHELVDDELINDVECEDTAEQTWYDDQISKAKSSKAKISKKNLEKENHEKEKSRKN